MTDPAIRPLSSLAVLRRQIADWRAQGETIALVPTMGALHAGHLDLVALARRHARRVAASIFVNPAQFAPNEDYARYPRDLDGDLAKLAGAGCDLVWSPDAETMYPAGFATAVVPSGAAHGLEGDFRPHFFQGVATVCTKLFNQVAPDVAVFGEKDYQQLAVIRQLVRDLDLPMSIVGAPTVREPDGLALSSRNRYLTPAERAIAPALNGALRRAAAAIAGNRKSFEAAEQQAGREILAAGFASVDYVAIRDAETLALPGPVTGTRPLRILAAAWLGRTRLIDNIAAP